MNESSYIFDFFLSICQFPDGSEEGLTFKGAENSEFLIFFKKSFESGFVTSK